MTMAGNLTDYAEDALLDHLTGRAAMDAPTATYAALFTVAPTDSTGGTEVSSTSTGYSRADYAVTWGPASGGSIANTDPIRFPGGSSTATADWGTIVAIGIMDDSGPSANILMYGTLAASIVISTGDSYTISPGGLTLSLD